MKIPEDESKSPIFSLILNIGEYAATLSLMLSLGMNLNCRDSHGETPLIKGENSQKFRLIM
jgi:hypothetical protein